MSQRSFLQRLRHLTYEIPAPTFDPQFTVKVADSKDELEAAFRLTGQHSKELKCSIYSFLPQTVTAVVKYKNFVVGAIIIVKDSTLGLPSDQYYLDENTHLRQQGEQLIEISNLGIDPSFRVQSESIQHLLIKFSCQFIKKFMYGSVLLINTHPQSEVFFTQIWDFQRIGEIVKYKSSKTAYIVLLAWNLNDQPKKTWFEIFQSSKVHKNIKKFLDQEDRRFSFPVLKEGQVISPVMTPELLEYFFVTKTSVYEELNLSARKLFLEIFLQFFGEAKIERFLNIEHDYFLKEYRAPTRAKVTIQGDSEKYSGKIIDISSQGCFVELNEKFHSLQENLTLSFRLGDQNLSVTGKALWRNENQLVRYPMGYGIKFHKPKQEIINELQSWIKTS